MSLNHFLYYIRKGVMYSRVLASLNSNHTIKACHAIFLEGSPGHTIVQCRGLAFARVEVICILYVSLYTTLSENIKTL